MSQDEFQMLLSFFKVLGNENRLKIAGILASRDCTVRELAELLDLREPTVSEHLAMMKEIGLVTVTPRGNFRVYSFNAKALYGMNKDLLSRERLAALVEESPQDYEAKVLKTFVRDGRLVNIPTGRRRLTVIIRWLVEKFEYDRRYTEKEVNAIISQYHEDYATLRREMVDAHLMHREKGIYWRVEPEDIPQYDEQRGNETE